MVEEGTVLLEEMKLPLTSQLVSKREPGVSRRIKYERNRRLAPLAELVKQTFFRRLYTLRAI